MTEKEYHKAIIIMQKQLHDLDSLDQIYHHIKRELRKESDSYQSGNSIGSFLWDRLLGQGGTRS